MPSSMIFASLVVLWLLILVPAVARRRQEVARPSVAALSGRVLERPLQRQSPAAGREREVDRMDEVERDTTRDHGDDPGWTEEERDDRRWERPPPRYRPGRGGFDPEAAAIAARARYAFRQRVVLAMLITAVVTGVIAAVALPGMWWPHAAVDVALVGYLVYLRRQVRLEEAIRERRAARMAGTRRTAAADDPELDSWARRGRDVTRPEGDDPYADDADALDDAYDEDAYDEDDDESGPDDDLLDEEPERIPGTGEPLRRAHGRDEPEDDPTDGEPALPRLRPAPPPALPAGTALVEADEDDPDLYELDGPARPDYRRAAGE
ncbi:gephyrin-like molybdotransferase receptor GlpR [Pseudonocardia sichuanensis]